MIIGFAGLDHLGVVSSIVAAHKGYPVIAYDPREQVIDTLNRNLVPFYELGLQDLLIENTLRLRFTNQCEDLRECSLVFISADIKGIDNEIEDLVTVVKQNIWDNRILVIMSQVPPGFTRKIDHPSERLFYQAEILIVGDAIEKSNNPEQIIIGSENPDRNLPEVYYNYLEKFNCDVAIVKYESAEMAKIAINNLLASSVMTTNVLSEICEHLGVDWSDIIPILQYDKRIGPYAYVQPGLGLSGGHLERDVDRVEAWYYEFKIGDWKSRKNWIMDILIKERLEFSNKIAIWGLTYKANTSSIENSMGIKIMESLEPFKVQVYDPQVTHLLSAKSAEHALLDAEVLLILTPWEEFSEWDAGDIEQYMKGNVIVDPYGVLDRQKCIDLGFKYYQFGVSN